MRASEAAALQGSDRSQEHTPGALRPGGLGTRWERWRPLFPALLCGLFTGVGWLTADRPLWSGIALVLAFISGGVRPTVAGLQALREGRFDVDLLMVVAALGAAALGLALDGAVLIFIFALSNSLEEYALRRSRREMTSLIELRPTHAFVLRDGHEVAVPVNQLRVGDRVVIRPGGQIPCDGRVMEGTSQVNQASITGESLPVEKQAGDDVFAGTINVTGALVVEVTKEPGNTLLDRIVQLVEHAREQKSDTQRTVDRFERVYSWIVVGAVAVSVLVMWLGLGWSVRDALFRSLVLLIIASPCAIVLSSMPAVLAAMSHGAREGILIKGGGYLEQMGKARVIAFDKTGTLTTGRPVVAAVESWSPRWSDDDLLAMAASLEELVDHPIGEAVVARAEQRGLRWERAEDVQIHAGMGVSGRVAGHHVWLGSPSRIPSAMKSEGRPQLDARLDAAIRAGHTPVAVFVDGTAAGLITVSEALRPGVEDVIAAVKQMGVERVVMLTGDNEASARTLADRLGIDYQANLLPHEKVDAVRALQHAYGTVMMVGDGVNDGPALAQADVGVAMGGAGTDVALEAADVVLMADDLRKLPVALSLGRRVNRTVMQNLGFAVAVIVVLVIANFAGWLSLPMAVIGHEGSSLIVTVNGLRLLR